VRIFRFEESLFYKVETEESKSSFMAFRFKSLGQEEGPDTIKEGIIELGNSISDKSILEQEVGCFYCLAN